MAIFIGLSTKSLCLGLLIEISVTFRSDKNKLVIRSRSRKKFPFASTGLECMVFS